MDGVMGRRQRRRCQQWDGHQAKGLDGIQLGSLNPLNRQRTWAVRDSVGIYIILRSRMSYVWVTKIQSHLVFLAVLLFMHHLRFSKHILVQLP